MRVPSFYLASREQLNAEIIPAKEGLREAVAGRVAAEALGRADEVALFAAQETVLWRRLSTLWKRLDVADKFPGTIR